MLVKSVIAGTVLSLMAGGVVYFGTDVDAGELKEKAAAKTAEVKAELSDKVMAGGEDHPHGKKTEMSKGETSINMPSVKTPSGKLIEAKKPTVSYSSESETNKTADTQDSKLKTDESKPQKKWLNQYLKKDTPKAEKKAEAVMTEEVVTEEIEGPDSSDTETSVAKELMDSMGLTTNKSSDSGTSSDSDTGTFIVEDDEPSKEDIEMAEAEDFAERLMETENIWVEDSEGGDSEKTVDVKVIENEDSKTTIETETIDMGDGKIMKIVKKTVKSEGHDKATHGEKHKKVRIKVFTDENGEGGMGVEDIEVLRMGDNLTIHELMTRAKRKDISGTVKVVMEQAGKIKMPELRDRAYLDLVSYGLDHGNYKVASKALKKIEQVELRDTARNRIAVAYAKEGKATEAFGILDDLEVDALRDVMRLQVIEAMIAPDELPKDMQ